MINLYNIVQTINDNNCLSILLQIQGDAEAEYNEISLKDINTSFTRVSNYLEII